MVFGKASARPGTVSKIERGVCRRVDRYTICRPVSPFQNDVMDKAAKSNAIPKVNTLVIGSRLPAQLNQALDDRLIIARLPTHFGSCSPLHRASENLFLLHPGQSFLHALRQPMNQAFAAADDKQCREFVEHANTPRGALHNCPQRREL